MAQRSQCGKYKTRKYRTLYRAGNKVIDLSVIKDGTPFEYASIGGYETLWFLKDDASAECLI